MPGTDLSAEQERLRAAGRVLRARSLEDRIEVLGRALDALADPGSRARRALERDLPAATGFSSAVVAEGLALAMSSWGSDGLRELVGGELEGAADWPDAPGLTAVVPAGAIPMPTLEAMLAPLLIGSAVMVRPASRDRVTARVFRELLGDLDEGLGAAVGIVDFDHDDEPSLRSFLSVDAVIASGDDATIRRLEDVASSAARFVGYGHRFSLAVVVGPADEATARALALDISLWDQLGCLSPLVVMALGDVDGWADQLATALAESCVRLPRGDVPLAGAASIQRERAEAELRATLGPTRTMAGETWTVIREADATWRPAPLYRFVRVLPIEQAEVLDRVIGARRSSLSTLAIHAQDAGIATAMGVRITAPGTCQAPPLHWNHDGIGTLRPLLGLSPRR